jgi:hypothetical protein
MSVTIQIRRQTASNWTTNNPTLHAGEIGFETDTKKFKIGDGTTAWTSLKYSTPTLYSAAALPTEYVDDGHNESPDGNVLIEIVVSGVTYYIPAYTTSAGY